MINVPKQGDIIKLNLNPTKGHEQAGYRPVLVINNASFSQASNMIIVCPITNTDKNNPLHVKIKESTTKGFVLCDQVRAVDVRSRDFKTVEAIDEDTLWEVCDILKGSVDLEG
jgi:mRNA interferase MazF